MNIRCGVNWLKTQLYSNASHRLTVGEWEFGGFPAWLIGIEPQITLRTYEMGYINAVKDWWEVLLPTIRPMLVQNGGNIIMMQIENEFGSVLLWCMRLILFSLYGLFYHFSIGDRDNLWC